MRLFMHLVLKPYLYKFFGYIIIIIIIIIIIADMW